MTQLLFGIPTTAIIPGAVHGKLMVWICATRMGEFLAQKFSVNKGPLSAGFPKTWVSSL